MSTIPASLRALLSGLIDYAGLFPPAELDMNAAVNNYARYLAEPDAWALGRFVVPVARFGEFEAALHLVRPVEPWGVSALLGSEYESELAEIDRFNQRNLGRAAVDTVETKAATPEAICHIRAVVRGSITSYFEIPADKAPELLPTMKAIHTRAKIRTGGLTADTFPSTASVARFIVECAKHQVAFKATAGLHHPLRCVKPLTYAADSPKGTMHGFLNVFLAAALAHRGVEEEGLMAILEQSDGLSVRFHDGAVHWHGHSIGTDVLETVRRNFAISFGSCSFEEPLSDLRELKVL